MVWRLIGYNPGVTSYKLAYTIVKEPGDYRPPVFFE